MKPLKIILAAILLSVAGIVAWGLWTWHHRDDYRVRNLAQYIALHGDTIKTNLLTSFAHVTASTQVVELANVPQPMNRIGILPLEQTAPKAFLVRDIYFIRLAKWFNFRQWGIAYNPNESVIPAPYWSRQISDVWYEWYEHYSSPVPRPGMWLTEATPEEKGYRRK